MPTGLINFNAQLTDSHHVQPSVFIRCDFSSVFANLFFGPRYDKQIPYECGAPFDGDVV